MNALGRIGRDVAGVMLILLGLVLIPLPGPGLLVVLAGLYLLAKDHPWAARLLDKGRARLDRATSAVRNRARGTSPATTTNDDIGGAS